MSLGECPGLPGMSWSGWWCFVMSFVMSFVTGFVMGFVMGFVIPVSCLLYVDVA